LQINQPGFQSTSLSEEKALSFAKPEKENDVSDSFISVLLEIELK